MRQARIAGRRFTGIVKPHEAFPDVARLDREVNDRTNRLRLGSRADAALVRLSTLADHGVLWAGAALGLTTTGRRGRDAALRGYASLLAASAVANLGGKVVFGGERPSLEPLPLWRRLREPPTSPSFPSGHAASAAAFATGVAIEWPAAGAVVAPLAGAVVYSRLHTGSHWLSDVVAGVAVGTGVALLGRALVPRSPGPWPDVPAGPRADVPALPDGAGLFAVVNPAAGSGRLLAEDPERAVRAGLPAADVHVLAPGEDLGALYDEAVARGARALGISGGDGTVSTAAAAARAHGLPLAVFPGGTLNHFAKAADLTSMDATVRAVRAGTGVVIDVADLEVLPDGAGPGEGHDGPAPGRVASGTTPGAMAHGAGSSTPGRPDDGGPNGADDDAPGVPGARTFTVLNTFSAGVYPELVTEREKIEHRVGKWPAAVWAAGRVLRRARRVRLEVDGSRGEFWSLFAGVNRYYPQSLAPVERERLDDGVLDVRTARAERSASRLRTFLEVAAGDRGARLARQVPGLRRHLVVDASTSAALHLRVLGSRTSADDDPDGTPADGREATGSNAPVVLAHDGETLEIPGGDGAASGTRVTLTMRERALRIYAPEDPAAG